MRVLRGNEALRQALAEEMTRDERVFVLGEDLARHGGVFRVTEGLLDQFGPERVMDTPISESGIVGFAVGAALMGMRAVVELQFADLIPLAADQLANTAAKARYVHDGKLHAPLVVRTVGVGAGTVYASQALEAWFTHVPGLKVVMPSEPAEASGLLLTAIRDPDPVLFIEHRALYAMRGPVPEPAEAIPFGKARVVREGADVTIVAWATMVSLAQQAADDLAVDGVSVEVIDLRTLVPFDLNAVVESVERTGRLVIVHESVRRSGFGAEIAATVADSKAFDSLLAPIVRVANPGVPVPHGAALRKHALPTKDDLIAAVRRVTEYG